MRNQRRNPLIESGLAGGWGWELGRPCSTPQPFTPGKLRRRLGISGGEASALISEGARAGERNPPFGSSQALRSERRLSDPEQTLGFAR